MQWILHRVTALSRATELRDNFGEEAKAEDEWFAYTPSPEKPSPPSAKSSPRLSPPPSSLPPCHSLFPSAAKEVEFGTTITTADESIVSSAGGAIDRGDEVKEDTPTGEGKGKRRADIDAVAKFEEREAKKRMVLSSEKCWGNRTSYSQRRKGSREWIERDGLHALQCSQIDQRVSKWKTDICDVFQE
jgi:hypothetical protein